MGTKFLTLRLHTLRTPLSTIRPWALGIRKLPHKPPTSQFFSSSQAVAAQARRSAPVISYDTPAGVLAKKGVPVLLYNSGSNLPYIVGCYIIGGSILACAVVNNHTKNLAAVADVPAYVPLATAVGVFMMVGVGAWMCLKPQNMVRTIRSIPSKGPKSGSVVLEIERSQSLPFVHPKPVTVSPNDITVSAPLFLGGSAQVRLQLQIIQRKEDRAFAFATDNLLSLPFRQAGYWLGVIFLAVKKAFTNSGLVHFHIRGYNIQWKMERDGAWALEDGRFIDNLVKIKEV